MRMMVFFDLPMEKSKQRKAYTKFLKELKKQGFLMLQKSVYIKLSINLANVDVTRKNIKKILPSEGNVFLLVITEKQFSSIEYLLGDFKTNQLNDEERVVEIWN